MKTQFHNKETYLAYLSNWKATYKQLSQEIRLLRYAHNATQRPTASALAGDAKHIQAAKKLLNLTNIYNGTFLHAKQSKAAQATCMLEELKVAKQEANLQYQAEHSKSVVA